MAKIDRYTGNYKPFGANSQGTERTIFEAPGATDTQSDTLDTNINTDYLRGWGDNVVGPSQHPTRQQFNAGMFTLGQTLAYLHQQGIAEWDSLQEYPEGAVSKKEGRAFVSLSDANIGSDPDSSSDWTPLGKRFNVKEWGAKGDGITDDRAAIQAVIDIAVISGGEVFFPTGQYLVNGVTSPDTLLNGILIPFQSLEVYPGIRLIGEGNSVILAGSASMICVRASTAGVHVENITFDGNSKSDSWGIGAVSENRFANIGVVSQSHLQVKKCVFRGLTEGVVLEPGQNDGPSGSGAYYPIISDNDFTLNTRAIWLKEATDVLGNRPTRGNVSGNRIDRGNAGIDAEYCTEFLFEGNNFEFINSGTSPLATPSAYHLGQKSEFNVIVGGHSEAATADVNNEATSQNNQFVGFSLYGGGNINDSFLPANTPDLLRLTPPFSVPTQIRFEAVNPTFGALVFDPDAANTKKAALQLNNSSVTEWFNGIMSHKGTVSDIEFGPDGRTVSSTGAFLRLRGFNEAVYLGVNDADDFRLSPASIRPSVDNATSCGEAALRWSTVYAATGTINTSDERTKTDLIDLDATERAVALELKSSIKKFKFKDAIAKKGENGARIHVGVGAQTVKAIFEKHGLNPAEYALFCWDQWEDIYSAEELDEEAAKKAPVLQQPAGDRYGIRYEELLAFIIAAI